MSDTVTLTVHESSFDNRLTVDFLSISSIKRRRGSSATLVAGICEGRETTLTVHESPRQIREHCAEKQIPCEEEE